MKDRLASGCQRLRRGDRKGRWDAGDGCGYEKATGGNFVVVELCDILAQSTHIYMKLLSCGKTVDRVNTNFLVLMLLQSLPLREKERKEYWGLPIYMLQYCVDGHFKTGSLFKQMYFLHNCLFFLWCFWSFFSCFLRVEFFPFYIFLIF